MPRLFSIGFAVAFLSLIVISPASAEDLKPLRVRFAPGAESKDVPNFQRHVVALMGRLGCNGRNCHGSFQGAGGFRLSLFGFDFKTDHDSLLDEKRMRVVREDAGASKILTKPTDADAHKGGKRFEENGWEYRVLHSWIAGGAKEDSAKAGKLVRLDVTPREIVFAKIGESVPLRALAVWSDGTREDVTCLTRFSTNNDVVATVSDDGVITAVGKGDTAIVATYDSAVVPVSTLQAVSDRTGAKYPAVVNPTKVDELIANKLRKLGVVPSDVCTDAEFLRRASLDITGTLPTPEEVTAFLADATADKRDRKIDELLARPAYATWWATKFCDWTGLNAPQTLGGTEFAKPCGEMWYAWVRKRFETNLGYDKIAEGMILAVSRKPGESYEQFAARMSGHVRKKDPTDFADEPHMPYFWFRSDINQADEKALAFAYSFLGVRLDCAQCHKHPFDQWTQKDFTQFAAVFSGMKSGISPESEAAHAAMQKELGNPQKETAANRRGLYRRLSEAGKPAPWREIYFDRTKNGAKILGGELVSVADGEHPLTQVMAWLRDKDNPYFAPAFVNRVWAYYMGKGIVNPPDDFNLGNPPSNPALLDYLAEEFVTRGYDIKWLHREIVRSHAYQRSWKPNATNAADENFSRAAIRRLPAEVALDAVLQATASDKRLKELAATTAGRRIGEQATADYRRTEYPLVVFGKPLRLTNCDCERVQDPSLLQSLFLRNDPEFTAAVDRTDGWIKSLPAKGETDALIRTAYLRTVSRLPTAAELSRCREEVSKAVSPAVGIRNVLWALLNTKEFATNH